MGIVRKDDPFLFLLFENRNIHFKMSGMFFISGKHYISLFKELFESMKNKAE
jgi:hypothetical protein